MKNHFLITFSRVAELGGKVVYSVPPSREFRAQTVAETTLFSIDILDKLLTHMKGLKYYKFPKL